MSKMELFSFKDNCRLCLKTHTDFMKNIFTHCVEGYQATLVQNIFALFRVELNPHKDYSQFICRKCLTELENIILFKEDLQRNQDFLLGLFSAAYPNHGEKDLHSLDHSGETGIFLKSVGVNTDPEIDLKNLGDSEYVRVPVDFLKQFSPQVNVERAEVGALDSKFTEVKKEVTQNDTLNKGLRSSVHICKYCKEKFRSQVLVNAHCKKFHEQQKKHETRKRISNNTQNTLAKKTKTDQTTNVSLPHVPKLAREQITVPQLDLQNNNNTTIKAEISDSPPDQQIDKILSTGPIFQENQALFLQNFNLIAKQEADLIQTQQKSLKRTPKRSCLKNRILKKNNTRKSVAKPLKSNKAKDKIEGKPLSSVAKKRVRSKKRMRSKNIEQEIVCRSLQFLKRYGWRKLNSSSRRGTTISSKVNNLFQLENEATKSVSKKVISPKNSSKSSSIKKMQLICECGKFGTSVKEENCDPENNCDDSKQALELVVSDVKLKKSESVDVSDNQSLGKVSTITVKKQSLKDSPSTSFASNKSSSKAISIDDIESALKFEIKSDLKIERSPTSSKGGDKTKDYKTISSRSFYDKNKNNMHINDICNNKVILDKQNDEWLKVSNLRNLDSSEYLQQKSNNSKTKLPVIKRKSYRKTVSRSNSPSPDKPQTNLNKTDITMFQSGNTECFLPTDDLEVKKELRIQLERDESPEKHEFFNSSFDIKSNKHSQVVRRRGRPKKIDLEKRGSPVEKQCNNNELSVETSWNLRKKETGNSGITNDGMILKLNDVSNETLLVNGKPTAVSKKRGRPRKNLILEGCSTSSVATEATFDGLPKNYSISNNKLPLLDVTQSVGYIPPSYTRCSKSKDLSTLQDLNDRYEKGDNIGLRIRLRKTISRESLNILKYDTQELDENLQIKAETKNNNANIDLSNVPDNKILIKSHDREVDDESISNISLKQEPITEKVVNLDLEDEEIQMLVLVRDNVGIDFDNDDISKYVKLKNMSSNLDQKEMLNQSKTRSSLERRSSFSIIDNGIKQKQCINRSQTCLPLNIPKFKEFDNNPSEKDASNSLTRSKEGNLQTTPVKRRGRPPSKFTPSTYVSKRSNSATRLLKNENVGLANDKCEPRSKSINLHGMNKSKKELFNEIRRKSRTPKRDDINNISASTGSNSSSSMSSNSSSSSKQSFLNLESLKLHSLNASIEKLPGPSKHADVKKGASNNKLKTRKEKDKRV